MAAAQPPPAQGEICPDPTAHGHIPQRLQDQASKAALYVTQSERDTHPEPEQFSALGSDGKLSSAGAATSLKHASPQDLPSFPTVGIDTTTSGNAAANIAHRNQKPFEHWKPGDLSSSAGKAALTAHQDGGKLNLWQPTPSDPGHTAAGAAMSKQAGLAPRVDYGYTDDGHNKALLAAKLSVKARGRSDSTPAPAIAPRYPDAENASHNALNAASIAHKPTVRKESPYRVSSAANEAARLTHMQGNINREMFTEHPPIAVETEEEKKRKAALKGATLAHTRKAEDAAAEAQRSPNSNADPMTYARNHLNLQEQARKLASERLERLDPDGVKRYRDHYGYSSPHRSRLSIRSRRTRSSSEGNERRASSDDGDDAKRAGRIRHQMSRFNDEISHVDKQRQTDRKTLMAAAEKSVKQRMSTMDRQIFDETGKVTPAVMEEWEAKARTRAAEQSEKRLEHHGMVNVGGGKFMDEKDVEAIAASRLQPTLDEISANADKQRARDEEIRIENERKKEQAANEKQAKAEEKELAKTKKRLDKEEARQYKEASKEQELLHKEAIKEQEEKAKETAKERKEASKKSTDEPRKSREVTSPPSEPRKSKEATRSQDSDKSDEIPAGATAAEAGATTAGAAAAEEKGKKETPKESRGRVSQKLTKGERAAMGSTKADPPGVPTHFEGRSAPHPEVSGRPDQDNLAPTTSVSEEPREVQKTSGPSAAAAGVHFKRNEKRDSRVRSWLGKLKRSSKHDRAAREGSPSTGPISEGKEKEIKEEKGEGTSEGDSGLYSRYSDATDISRPKSSSSGKDDTEPIADGGIAKGKAPSSRSISPPTPRARDNAEFDRGRAVSGDSGIRESLQTTSADEEFEEAKDKFDEGELRIPEPVGGGRASTESPGRTGSRFVEEL